MCRPGKKARAKKACALKNKQRPAILKTDFDDDEFDTMWKLLIVQAGEVPSEQDGHTSILDILLDQKIRSLVFTIFTLVKLPPQYKHAFTYQFVVGCFLKAGVDISIFRDDMEEQFKNRELGDFLKMNVVYTFRYKQTGCAKCGRKIDDFMFGAVGYQSNHYADDNVETDEERSKWFGVDASNFGRTLEYILFELCLTRLECWKCHNTFGPHIYDRLPSECYGEYRKGSISAVKNDDENLVLLIVFQ